MKTHNRLLKEKFAHSTEDLLYNSGGDVMWSLFKFTNWSVTIYYHDSDSFHILSSRKAKWHELDEIADNWDPVNESLII